MFPRLFTHIAALLLIAGATGCAPGRGSEGEDVVPEVRFQELRFEVYRGVALEASGVAREARMRRDTSAVEARQIQVEFPADAGADRPPALLAAATGVGNAADRWFELQGGVTATQGEDVVETERARLEGRLVRGDAEVTVRGPGYALRGPGFVLDPDARTVRVEGGASLRTEGAVPGSASR